MPKPPYRTTHATGPPTRQIMYDRWGAYGRPVLLLHSLLFDRTMWWPVAAELATECTVLAPDLPGHGDTPGRTNCPVAEVAADLAALIHRLDLHRAPVVVGHATAATLALTFADRFAVHGVVTVDEPTAEAAPDLDAVIAAAGSEAVPAPYRPFARPRRDPAILDAYRSWFAPAAGPRAGSARTLSPAGAPARPETDTRFAHLADPTAFAAGLRTLL